MYELANTLYLYSKIKAKIPELLIWNIDELKKKDYYEILTTLAKRGYIRQISKEYFDDIIEVEKLLWYNFSKEVNLIMKYSSKGTKQIVGFYHEKLNIYNLKNCLRLYLTKNRELIKLFIPTKEISLGILLQLEKEEDINKIVNTILAILENKTYSKLVWLPKKYTELIIIEKNLDKYFYENLAKISNFSPLIRCLIDVYNIKNSVLNVPFIPIPGGFININMLPHSLPIENKEILRRYPQLEDIKDIIDLNQKLREVVIQFCKTYLTKSFFDKDFYLAYIILKDIEVESLIELIIQKRYEK